MAVEDWQLDAVRDSLQRASDVGETRTRAALQNEVGIGAGDLQGVLDELRQRGELTETAPGEYETLTEELRAERAAARAPASAAEEEPPPRARAAAARLAAPPSADDEMVEVALSRGVAGALDEAALGKLIKAGLDESAEKQTGFRFEVAP